MCVWLGHQTWRNISFLAHKKRVFSDRCSLQKKLMTSSIIKIRKSSIKVKYETYFLKLQNVNEISTAFCNGGIASSCGKSHHACDIHLQRYQYYFRLLTPTSCKLSRICNNEKEFSYIGSFNGNHL